MVELALRAHRGSFHLDIECTLAAPWTVVFGPSGAGKSTLLRLIAGLDRMVRPDSGHIAIHGRLVTDTVTGLHLRPGKRSTGLVAQQSALFPHLRVVDNVAYGLTDLSRQASTQRVSAMLELVGAASLADRSPRSTPKHATRPSPVCKAGSANKKSRPFSLPTTLPTHSQPRLKLPFCAKES